MVIEVLFDDPMERLSVFQVVTKSFGFSASTTVTFVHPLQLSPSFDSAIVPTNEALLSVHTRTE